MTIAFHTLGCKVNQYETGLLKEQFSSKGYTIVPDSGQADVYLINSCTVTGTADKKIRQIIRRFKRLNPQAIVAVTGCFPQAFPEEATAIKEADIIMGTKERLKVIEHIENFKERMITISPHSKEDGFEESTVSHYGDKTRAFVKVQEGCDRYCSYCVIPYARGHVRSKKPVDVIEEIKGLIKTGHKEVVLVGINLSMYGRDLDTDLTSLTHTLCKIEGLDRIRLGSTEPMLVTAENFISLSAEDKLCPHFHIALQSGCDSTLKRMKRPYTTAEYMDIINTVREKFNNPTITTDIIVGFPGETEEEFAETLDFVRKVAPSDVHIFPYSKRKGTAAYDMEDHISPEIKKQRVVALSNLCDQLKKDFLHSQLGSVSRVIFERTVTEDGRMGHTDNYTPVYVSDDRAVAGEIYNVRITSITDEGNPIGELVI